MNKIAKAKKLLPQFLRALYIALFSSVVIANHGCGSGSQKGPQTVVDQDYTSNPSRDLVAHFSDLYKSEGTNYTYSNGAVPDGSIGQIVNQVSGTYYGSLGDFFNPSKNYTDEQKAALLTALISVNPNLTTTSFSSKIAGSSSSGFTGVLGAIGTLIKNDSNNIATSVSVTWGKAVRKQISSSKFQEYIDTEAFDPKFVADLRTSPLEIYDDTIELEGLLVETAFSSKTTSLTSAGIKGNVIRAFSLDFKVENNFSDEKSLKLSAQDPAVIATKRTAGAAYVASRPTAISLLDTATSVYYDPGTRVTARPKLLASDGKPIPGAAVKVTLFYTKDYEQQPNPYTSFPGVTDANGECVIAFQLPNSNEDYYMVSEFDGFGSYAASKSFPVLLRVGGN